MHSNLKEDDIDHQVTLYQGLSLDMSWIPRSLCISIAGNSLYTSVGGVFDLQDLVHREDERNKWEKLA